MKKTMILAGSVILLTVTLTTSALGGKGKTKASVLMKNVEALAEDEDEKLWFRTDKDCTYSGTGSKNTTIKVTIRGKEYSVGTNSEGKWSYTISGGKTHCTSGGHEQCTARYC